jgi:hypothetical protein
MGVAQGVNSWFWSMGGTDWIAEWAQAVLNTPNGILYVITLFLELNYFYPSAVGAFYKLR